MRQGKDKILKKYIIDYLIELPNFLSIFMFPVLYMLASPILLDISLSIETNPGDLSLIFTFFIIGSIIGQLTSIFYTAKFKKSYVILICYILLVPVTIFLSLSSKLYIFYILYFLSGYIMGIIWIKAYENILDSEVKNKDRIIMIALCFYPIGAFITPFISSVIVNNNLSWRFIYYVIVIFIIIISILYLVIRRKNIDKIQAKQYDKIVFKEVFKNRNRNIVFIITAITFMFYCISETIIFTWSPTFFRTEMNFDINTTGLILSIFWIFIFLGRLILSFLAGKIPSNYIILILSIVSIISITFMILSNSKHGVFIAAGFAGLGCSGIYPLLVSSGSTIYKDSRGVLPTILFVSAATGQSIAPYFTRLFSKYNMTFSVSLSIIFMIITMIFIVVNILYNKLFMYK